MSYKKVKLNTNLVKELEEIAKSNNTDINQAIGLILSENEEYKTPRFLTSTKISKNKSTYSSVIPAPIKNKFGLEKGQVLYWDIEDNKIIITPEPNYNDLPETPSLEAGNDILQDFLLNNNNHYGTYATNIISQLRQTNKPNEEIIENILLDYNLPTNDKEGYKKVILYFLDYPLDIPNQYEILQEVYNQITKGD